MLIARSSRECQLYMDLHACPCGQVRFPAQRELRRGPNATTIVSYRGQCPRCRQPRAFTFQLEDPSAAASAASAESAAPGTAPAPTASPGGYPAAAPPAAFPFASAAGAAPFGGARPSRIIDPGEFMLAADQAQRAAPADPRGLGAPELARARALLGTAVAAVEEVLKFIPDGRSEVPSSAFTSRAGAEVYRRDPSRFSRTRLAATLNALRRSLAAYETR